MSQLFLNEEETPFHIFIKKYGVYIAMASTAFGLFAGIPLLIYLANITVVNAAVILLLIFICGGLGLVQWRWVHRMIDMEYHQFAMYAYSGFGMCLINFIFILNFFIPISEHSETYSIKHIGVYNRQFEVHLVEDVGTTIENLVSDFTNQQFEKTPLVTKVTVNYNTGLFGFDTVGGCVFE